MGLEGSGKGALCVFILLGSSSLAVVRPNRLGLTICRCEPIIARHVERAFSLLTSALAMCSCFWN